MRQVIGNNEEVFLSNALPWLLLVDLLVLLQVPVLQPDDVVVQSLAFYLDQHRHLALLVLPIVVELLDGHEVVDALLLGFGGVLLSLLPVKGLEDRAECSAAYFFQDLVALSEWVKLVEARCFGRLILLRDLHQGLVFLGLLLLPVLLTSIEECKQIVIGLIVLHATTFIIVALVLPTILLLNAIASFRHLPKLRVVIEI